MKIGLNRRGSFTGVSPRSDRMTIQSTYSPGLEVTTAPTQSWQDLREPEGSIGEDAVKEFGFVFWFRCFT
jgi:hypothetical protein